MNTVAGSGMQLSEFQDLFGSNPRNLSPSSPKTIIINGHAYKGHDA
jgi:hypothetical protein